VLPLALALPEPFALVALVVVSQTLVELAGMIGYVKVIPHIIRHQREPILTAIPFN
jgi:ACR3 family arsenite efflux pump ArsB